MSAERDRLNAIINAPAPRLRDHVLGLWSRRRAWNLVCATLAAVPGVRRYVLWTTAIKDHPMHSTVARANWKVWEARGLIVIDHPAGCFYGSFANAYPDNWHIPFDADCPLPHGPNPIKLEAPSRGLCGGSSAGS